MSSPDSDEERLKLKREQSKHGQTDDGQKDGGEIPRKLRKMTRDASEDKEDVFGKDSEAEAETKSSTSASSHLVYRSYEDVKKVLCNKPTLQQTISCVESLCKIFSESPPPPIADDCGFIPRIKDGVRTKFVQALNNENANIRLEALCKLGRFVNVTSGNAIAAVNAGVVPILAKMVLSDNPEVVDQALWDLCFIALDTRLRDCVFNWGGLDAIMHLVDRVEDIPLLSAQSLSYTLELICFDKTISSVAARKLRTVLDKLLQHEDTKIQREARRSLERLMENEYRELDLEIEESVQSLDYPFQRDDSRIDGCFAGWSTGQAEQILNLEVLEELIELSGRTCSADTVKEVCSLISKVTEVTQNQIIDVGFVGFVVNALATEDCKSHIEAVCALLDVVQRGTSELIYALVPEKVLPVLVKDLGEVKDARMQKELLETICTCLSTVSNHCPEQMDDVRVSFEVAGGLKHLEQLQSSELLKVDSRTNKMIQIIKILLE